MPDPAGRNHPPLILLAGAHEWASRSLESVLGPVGYDVVKVYTGRDVLARARTTQPDAVILDADLPELDGLAACRLLRSNALVTASTPILLTGSEPVTRQRTLEALRAGASSLWGQPLDTEEFLLRLDGHLRAKFDADRARDEGLIDLVTGLYNRRGLTRRTRELASQASRLRAPLACVVLAPDTEPGPAGAEPTGEGAEDRDAALAVALGRALEASGRVSDTIGRLGPTEFAVLAPHTDATGAAQLGARLVDAVERAGPMGGAGGARRVTLRAGYDAVADFQKATFDPLELLARATSALRASKASSTGARVRGFE
jgi:diguanylate cyclase (GGDEF)-like protein